jgi:2-polyprenyl-3-methyl-5-hydroxy-6-metoxy-1,4-benzoquinol methylase
VTGRDEPGGTPYQLKHFKYSSHFWIIKCLSGAPRSLRILDVGTADGYLGAILKAQGHSLVGVEHDQRLAAKAKGHYDEFHNVDIELFDFPYRGAFDYVLFADVLEHLRDPGAVLRRAMPSLKSGGKVIISLPNVANLYVRLNLLFGRFEYSDRGILDRTHLHFFTMASMREMIGEASWRVLEVIPTPLPIQLVLPWTRSSIFAPVHELHYLTVRLFKTLLAYQFVVCAEPAIKGSR